MQCGHSGLTLKWHDCAVRLWITGIPAVGKTTFCRWLRNEHGYDSCFDPGEPGVPVPDVEGFLRATASNVDVVVDWGIPASAVNWASTLIQTYGLEAWWFDGDRAVAKRRFDARRDLGEHIATEADHTRYLKGVTLGWDEYGVLFGHRVLDTLSSDDIFLPVEPIMATIEAYPR